MKLLLIALAAVPLAGCSPTDESNAFQAPSVETQAPPPSDSNPRRSVELARIPATALGDGFALHVAPPTGDPIERWGLCLARVGDCYTPGGSARSREACLRATDAAPTAGEAVCPRACREAFEQSLRGDRDLEAAVDATYKHGGCVTGFQALGDDALRVLSLNAGAAPAARGDGR